MVGSRRQPDTEEGLVGADGRRRVAVDRDPPATGVRDRGSQDPGARRRDPATDPVTAELEISQGMALDGPNLTGVVTVEFLGDYPVL